MLAAMVSNLLYGPRVLDYGYLRRIRSLTTDVETIVDAADMMLSHWENPQRGPREVRYWINRGPVTADELPTLGAHDRNTLTVEASIGRGADGILRTLTIGSENASVRVDSDDLENDFKRIIDYLYKNSHTRINWTRLRYIGPIAPLAVALAGYIWVLATTPLPAPLHVTLAGIIVLATAGTIAWSRRIYQVSGKAQGTIIYRSQSRAQTYADRANRNANLKVVFITAPVTLLLSIITAWALGILNLK